MPELAYREVYAMNRVEARHLLIQTFEKTGSYSQTARLWHTSRHVVRKWVRRYQELGEDGLEDQSRRPHHCATAELPIKVARYKSFPHPSTLLCQEQV